MKEEFQIMDVDQETINRIKEKTFKKAGLQTDPKPAKKNHWKALVAAAAILIIAVINYQNNFVASAFHQIYTFIQGYGYVTKESSNFYNPKNKMNPEKCDYYFTYAADALTADTKEFQILVSNSYIEGNKITLSWCISQKDASAHLSKTPEVTLYADGKECKGTKKEITSTEPLTKGCLYITGTYEYELPDIKVSEKTTYQMKFNNLHKEYQLDRTKKVENMGPVVSHNGIGYTAQAISKDGILTVYLYSDGKKPSSIRYANLCDAKDIYLKTEDDKIYPINDPQVVSGDSDDKLEAPSYRFKIPKGMKKAKLVVPSLMVSVDEKVTLKVPFLEVGESATLDKGMGFLLTSLSLSKVTMTKELNKDSHTMENTLTLHYDEQTKENRYRLQNAWIFIEDSIREKTGSYNCAQYRKQSKSGKEGYSKGVDYFYLSNDEIQEAKNKGYFIIKSDFAQYKLYGSYEFDLDF
ncbi:hypothetical protein lbkm_1166 [Lachnospiraceae bacterium KM106-2]|nr:hypothetical protein lbkm_1166 [Lachnospiraceae bacterium KM106-2]